VAKLLTTQGERRSAAQLLGLAQRSPEGASSWIWNLPDIVELHVALRTNLGPMTFQEAWETGQQRSLIETMESIQRLLGGTAGRSQEQASNDA
jgi:hypothetical protein